ncbi:hypothetical protein BJ138DRAFT_1166875 [Hygrophoropsis aurantiaca]|uniref:Uncharacterized protein n=1 Tax=Hygrophoropsis aurantiaca TaxID=72124 RepID=A0ACB7ZU41_9AGAM|nr:hypothetical protein BJ138DRAFT_1166875 [Hygrophoropsis aurantiaca]
MSSGRRKFIPMLTNYGPPMLSVIILLACFSEMVYDWADFASYFIGMPDLFCSILGLSTPVLALSMRPLSSIGKKSVQSMHWAFVACRVACILLHVCLVLTMIHLLVVIPCSLVEADYTLLGMALSTLALCSCYVLVWYRWYQRCWYERPIMAYNESLYGSTVFVSVPVFKCCGHFVLVVRNRKYELRLDAQSPIFNQRSLRLGEMDEIRRQFGHDWFIVGWTKKSDHEIRIAFMEAITTFGTYDRMHNNCRHFLQHGSWRILDATSTWHKYFLESRPVFVTLYSIWIFMHREIYRWIWTRWYGPGWENHSDVEYQRIVKVTIAQTKIPQLHQNKDIQLLYFASIYLGTGLVGVYSAILMINTGWAYQTADRIFLLSELLSVLGCIFVWCYALI